MQRINIEAALTAANYYVNNIITQERSATKAIFGKNVEEYYRDHPEERERIAGVANEIDTMVDEVGKQCGLSGDELKQFGGISQLTTDQFIAYRDKILKEKIGNCNEYCILAYDYLMTNYPLLRGRVKFYGCEDVRNSADNRIDHIFLAVDAPKDQTRGDEPYRWTDKVLICDPLQNQVYLAGVEGKIAYNNLHLQAGIGCVIPRDTSKIDVLYPRIQIQVGGITKFPQLPSSQEKPSGQVEIKKKLENYIARIESYKKNDKIDFSYGFWFFSETRGNSRRANYTFAKKLLDDLNDPMKFLSLSLLNNIKNYKTGSTELKEILSQLKEAVSDFSEVVKKYNQSRSDLGNFLSSRAAIKKV